VSHRVDVDGGLGPGNDLPVSPDEIRYFLCVDVQSCLLLLNIITIILLYPEQHFAASQYTEICLKQLFKITLHNKNAGS